MMINYKVLIIMLRVRKLKTHKEGSYYAANNMDEDKKEFFVDFFLLFSFTLSFVNR